MYYTSKDVYEFISKQNNDPIVEWKTCKVSGTQFPIYQSDLEFYDKISPIFDGTKYQIPTPTLCPEERQRRRLAFRNERNLYKSKCSATGESIISMYSPEKPYTVYNQNARRGDTWDALSYGKDIDVKQSFFKQFGLLKKSVPQISLIGFGNENCEYTNYGGYNKNCYLCFDYGYNADCLYLSKSYRNVLCSDMFNSLECEHSYTLVDSFKARNSIFSISLEECYSCEYCYNCKQCSNCFLCGNLINASYYILNKQYSKEEYESIIIEYKKNNTHHELQRIFNEKQKEFLKKNMQNLSCEHVIGNNLKECKNVSFAFDTQTSENVKYSISSIGLKDCCDDTFSGTEGSTLNFETIGCEMPTKCRFCISCRSNNNDICYCDFCHSCKNCFGCVGLRNKEYCVLNKQYTKEEYEQLVPQIIEQMIKDGEWGEFFDIQYSLFGYNETLAQEYFPLSREEALEKGYTRQDNNYDPVVPEGVEVLQGENIPTDIAIVTDDVLKKIFICEVSKRPFRIIKPELDFYRKHHLPLPRKHPDVRHEERLAQRQPRELHLRICDHCGIEMLGVYDKNYSGQVYCEACYNKEIYS